MVESTIVTIVQDYLVKARQSGINISKAILFGSHAKGVAGADSDLDVVVICPDFNETTAHEITNKLWKLRTQTDWRIEPVPIGQVEWHAGGGGVIADIARKDGVVISI
jgi:predicted nucleotidyltransferase